VQFVENTKSDDDDDDDGGDGDADEFTVQPPLLHQKSHDFILQNYI
jgi:hypothetical protein